MLFNSREFAVFLPCVLLIYLAIPRGSLRTRNLFLLAASYVFYGWWDWRFLILIAVSTVTDYLAGLGLREGTAPGIRRRWLTASVAVNLGMLGVCKYFNFFIESFTTLLSQLGVAAHVETLNIILPVGISFYTFQTLSYTLDVYKRRLTPCKDFLAFAAFVSFFPQLVAGPIERARRLLPQFEQPRTVSFGDFRAGSRQILWGLFKKMVIADNLAPQVNGIFADYAQLSPTVLVLGIVFFGFQIYADFSGYSDIAIGTARLFGFQLSVNFRYPYFSRDIAEFWRRWHISLSTWFRDYLYIPLGGSRVGKWLNVRNVVITFVVSGLWHGANWTFIFWGAFHAVCFLPLLLRGRNRRHLDTVAENSRLPSAREVLQIATTFALVSVAWVFFRSENLTHAFSYLGCILFNEGSLAVGGYRNYVFLIGFLVGLEWIGRRWTYPLERPLAGPFLDVVLLSTIFWMTVIWAKTDKMEFIYFQF